MTALSVECNDEAYTNNLAILPSESPSEITYYHTLASFPVPRPAFVACSTVKRGTASDEKLGDGLGTRLITPCFFSSLLSL